jgi:hypothetical protein
VDCWGDAGLGRNGSGGGVGESAAPLSTARTAWEGEVLSHSFQNEP